MSDTYYLVSGDELAGIIASKARATAEADARAGVVRRSGPAAGSGSCADSARRPRPGNEVVITLT